MSSQDTTAVRSCRDIDLQVFDGKVTKKCESGVYFQERTQTECAFVGARRGSKSLRAYPKTFYPFVRLAVLFEVPIVTRATFAMFLGWLSSFVCRSSYYNQHSEHSIRSHIPHLLYSPLVDTLSLPNQTIEETTHSAGDALPDTHPLLARPPSCIRPPDRHRSWREGMFLRSPCSTR